MPRSSSIRNPCPPLLARALRPPAQRQFRSARSPTSNQAVELDPKSPEWRLLSRGGVKVDQKQLDRRRCRSQPGDRAASGLCPGLCRARPGLCRDGATRPGPERPQHRDLDQCEPAQRLLLARPGLSPQGRRRARHRGFLARDRADAANRSRLVFRAGTALQRQGRLCSRDRGFRQGAVDRPERPGRSAVQQQRQSAVAMQAELAKVHGGQPRCARHAKAARRRSAHLPRRKRRSRWRRYRRERSRPTPPTLTEVGAVHGADGNMPTPLPRLNTCARGRSRNDEPRSDSCRALILTARFAEARTDIDAVLRLKPDDATACWCPAPVASLGMRQFDQAHGRCRSRAERQSEQCGRSISAAAWSSRLTGKFQDASPISTARSRSIDKELHRLLRARSGLHGGSTSSTRPSSISTGRWSSIPSTISARAARGLVLLLKGNNAEGLVDVKNALDRNPNNQVAELGQGLAMLLSGPI